MGSPPLYPMAQRRFIEKVRARLGRAGVHPEIIDALIRNRPASALQAEFPALLLRVRFLRKIGESPVIPLNLDAPFSELVEMALERYRVRVPKAARRRFFSREEGDLHSQAMVKTIMKMRSPKPDELKREFMLLARRRIAPTATPRDIKDREYAFALAARGASLSEILSRAPKLRVSDRELLVERFPYLRPQLDGIIQKKGLGSPARPR